MLNLPMEPPASEVEAMLLRRGLAVSGSGRLEQCLLPAAPHLDGYYARLHRYSFRLLLRDVLKGGERITARDVGRYGGEGSAASDIDYLASVGLLVTQGDAWRLERPVAGFGPTLEWYVAETLRREFLAPVLTDVRLGPPGPGGDYDVLAKLDDRLLYVEVKSSPPRQIYAPEAAAFLRRSIELGPDLVLFLVDTRLRMGDKIVPMFDDELRRLAGSPALEPLEREIYSIRGRLFVANSQPSVAANLAAVLRAYHARRDPLF